MSQYAREHPDHPPRHEDFGGGAFSPQAECFRECTDQNKPLDWPRIIALMDRQASQIKLFEAKLKAIALICDNTPEQKYEDRISLKLAAAHNEALNEIKKLTRTSP